jgi:uncharacterized protein YnzC (UPF0291/DUF896 family)
MSKQQIPTVCIQCQKHFLSKKRNTKFCSDICKAQEKRDRDKILHQSQAKVIRTQAEIIKVVLPKAVDLKPIPDIRNTGGSFKKRSDPAWLTSTLDGILFPSVSKWRAGKFNSAEITEFTRVAKEMGLTLDEYMKQIEVRKENSPEAIRKLFE